MPMSRMLVAVACLGALGWTAQAAEPHDYIITVREVEVRSGPSLKFYATSVLYHDDKVQIVSRNDGWLAIKPPPGSFSWVDASSGMQAGSSFVVEAEGGAAVRVGSRLLNEPPSVEPRDAKAPKGTILTVIGKAEVDGPVTWLPILPTPREVRYIPQEAAEPITSTALAQAPPPAPAVSHPFAQPQNPAPPASASLPAGSDLRIAGTPSLPPTNPGEASAANQRMEKPPASKANELHAELTAYTLSRPPASQAGSTPDPSSPVRLTSPAAGSPPSPSNKGMQWYEAGHLARTPLTEADGRPIYRIEPLYVRDPQNDRWAYVTAGPNVDLDSYVSKNVSLYGRMSYRGDLRNNHLTAMAVNPQQ